MVISRGLEKSGYGTTGLASSGSFTAKRNWPEGTLNHLVDKRLREMEKKLKADEKGEKDKEPEKKKEENNNEEPQKKEPGKQ